MITSARVTTYNCCVLWCVSYSVLLCPAQPLACNGFLLAFPMMSLSGCIRGVSISLTRKKPSPAICICDASAPTSVGVSVQIGASYNYFGCLHQIWCHSTGHRGAPIHLILAFIASMTFFITLCVISSAVFIWICASYNYFGSMHQICSQSTGH